ncbi:MAG: esterase family protein [Clostridia bacterium]|nr:esterase family protein [Clostridia bacterium]
MAFLELHYHSDALGIGVTVNVILPEKAKTLIGMNAEGGDNYKTLYLFHGLSDDQSIWMRRTSIERYAADYGIAVVMPSVNRSWYTDTVYKAKYFTFVTEELPRVCRSYFRGMSDKREDTLVAGLSMGGYGAVKCALRCPEKYGYCASLSGAMDIALRAERLMEEGVFGAEFLDESSQRRKECDLFMLAKENKEKCLPFPKLYQWCGTEDRLLDENRRYHALLEQLEIPHKYEESEGNHSWKWWDLHIQDALRYFFET